MYEVCVWYMHRARIFGTMTALEGYRCPPSQARRPGLRARTQSQACRGLSGRATAPCSLPWSGPENVGNYRTEVLPFGFHVGGKKPKGTCGCRPGPAEASCSPVGTPEASPGLPGSPKQRPWNTRAGQLQYFQASFIPGLSTTSAHRRVCFHET